MIAFVTSFRARALAGSRWDHHVWLLERVIASMLAQTAGDEIRVAVGCHDIPDTRYAADARVRFVPVAAAVPRRTNDDMVVDKVVKLSAAVRWAQAAGCDYVVFNDADDLVSSRIGAFVAANRGAAGWYTVSQRFYTYGGVLMRLQRIQAPASGPCAIVRSDLLTFASPPFTASWAGLLRQGGESGYLDLLAGRGVEVCVLAAVGIAHYRNFMAAAGHPLAPLPFAANVVINHADSTSTTGGPNGYQPLSLLGSLKRSVRWLPTLRLATPRIRREFHIPPDREIPARFRGGASVFRR